MQLNHSLDPRSLNNESSSIVGKPRSGASATREPSGFGAQTGFLSFEEIQNSSQSGAPKASRVNRAEEERGGNAVTDRNSVDDRGSRNEGPGPIDEPKNKVDSQAIGDNGTADPVSEDLIDSGDSLWIGESGWQPELLPTPVEISVQAPQQDLMQYELSSELAGFTSELTFSDGGFDDSFGSPLDQQLAPLESTLTLRGDSEAVAMSSEAIPVSHESKSAITNDASMNVPLQLASASETTSGPSAPQPTAVVDNVATRVVDGLVAQAKFAEAGDHKSLIVQLHPAELGQVTLQVDFEHDRLSAKLLANEHVASEILAQNRDRLVTALAENGLNFDSLEVSYQNSKEQTRQDGEDARNTFFPLAEGAEVSVTGAASRYYDARNQAVDIVV